MTTNNTFMTTYNNIYLLYKYPQYLNIDKNNNFILLPIKQINFDSFLYIIIQELFHTKKLNVYIFFYLLNGFFSDKQKKQAEILIQKIQRFKFALSRFKHMVLLKYKKRFNETTLLFEPFKRKPILIHEKNILYQFDDIELYNIIKNCFNYEEYYIPEILSIKNPYTNLNFSLHNLIYIYFELLKRNKSCVYFELLFKNNFNTEIILELYQIPLFINCMKKRYINLSEKSKKKILYDMLNTYNLRYKNFKNVNYNILYKLFKNYVIYFYIYKKININFDHEECLNYKYFYESKFNSRLMKIYLKNPDFGKYKMVRNINDKYKKIINDTIYI